MDGLTELFFVLLNRKNTKVKVQKDIIWLTIVLKKSVNL